MLLGRMDNFGLKYLVKKDKSHPSFCGVFMLENQRFNTRNFNLFNKKILFKSPNKKYIFIQSANEIV